MLLAMLGICVFLVWEAAPLLRGGSADPDPAAAATVEAIAAPRVVRLQPEAPRALLVDADGVLRTLSVPEGTVLAGRRLVPEGFDVAAVGEEPGGDRLLFGSADGRVLGVRIEERSYQLGGAERVAALDRLAPGAAILLADPDVRAAVAALPGAPGDVTERDYVERSPEAGFRLRRLLVESGEPDALPSGSGAVVHLATTGGDRSRTLAAVRADGSLHVGDVRVRRRLDGSGGTERARWRTVEVGEPFDPELAGIAMLDGGRSLVAAWPDGRALRIALAPEPRVVERVQTLEDPSDRLTLVAAALGQQSLIVGDSSGALRTFALVSDPDAPPFGDGRRLAITGSHRIGDAPVVSLGVGERDRTVVVGLADGTVDLRNLTSGKRVVRLAPERTGAGAGAAAAVAVAPPLNGVLTVADDGAFRYWRVDPGYPEASFSSLFGRVHYEGRDRPEFVYQSTGAEGAEPKYSLVPLVFGTLKATLFAMLFAVPVSVLAAIYTSEFLHPSVRRVVKPSIELMASLPSVVLGFVAAMLLAPLVRDLLPGVLVAFGVVPFVVLAAASLWRMAPIRVTRRISTLRQLGIIAAVMVAGCWLSLQVAGPLVERTLFAPPRADRLVQAGHVLPADPERVPGWADGRTSFERSELLALRNAGLFVADGRIVVPDRSAQPPSEAGEASLRGWLDARFGTAFPGWFLALIPPAACAVWIARARFVDRWWTARVSGLPRAAAGGLELLRLLAHAGATLAVSAALAWLLTLKGVDARDSVFGAFTQRNTLVVGLIMGFAIIPLIYTLSEDALRSVPESLRAGSLGAGATPWQTAVRVVLPVAGSGIFSAIMIGLGRAVGETMIVLMATGNTPTMELNLFEGFRALSANIAVEMPEVARGGTHYRVLFLCGLTLFAMTLVINTTAEFVRQHFRRRNAAL